MFDKNYEINSETYAIMPENNNTSKIIAGNETIIVNKSVKELLKYNCKYYGSTLNGRTEASKYALGMKYKLPIILEETREMIFFPTTSPEIKECIWISLNNILKYEKNDFQSKITFINGTELVLDISYPSLENQILRATKLLLVLKKRKL